MFNNTPLVHHLANQLDFEEPPQKLKVRERVLSDPCLPTRLPSTGFLQREAEQLAPKAIIKQLRLSPEPSSSSSISTAESDDDVQEQHESEEAVSLPSIRPRTKSLSSIFSSISSVSSNLTRGSASSSGRKANNAWREPQTYEIFRAVERKDIMMLMEVRDRAFHLLLRKSGDATPLLHAMRIGQSHQDVAILLVGAFSRYVNTLQDDEILLPRTKVLLKALRANLKLAIDFGLQSSQNDLIASFLQTLVMSEGDKWVWAQAATVGLALRAGTVGKPVHTAGDAVRSFATKELGKAHQIAALEDYIANATADLLMIAAWSIALDTLQGEQIPSYYFARDDRVYKAFVERLDTHKNVIERVLSRRLKWQFRVLRKVLEGRNTSYRSKVALLTEEFDEGEGV